MFAKQYLRKPQSGELDQARDVLLDNPAILRSKVRVVAAKGDTNGHALSLYTLAAGHRFAWTPDDWAAVLNKLDECELTVSDWLDALTND
jgi:hypothetical protein